MAQVGKISGPLLEANLLRQGIANGTQANLSFKNNAGDQSLLKIDVTNGRIGVDVEAPANECINGTGFCGRIKTSIRNRMNPVMPPMAAAAIARFILMVIAA